MVSGWSRKSADRGPDVEDEGGGVEECTVDEDDEEGGEDTEEDEEGGVDEAPGGDEGEGVVTEPAPEDGAEDMMTDKRGRRKVEREYGDDGVGGERKQVPNLERIAQVGGKARM